MATKELSFEMPDDGSWDPDLWDRLGETPEWDQIAADFETVGAEVEDTEDIRIEFPAKKEPKVRAIIEKARSGGYGPDIQTYWNAAIERQ